MTATFVERATTFECGGSRSVAIAALPNPCHKRGVLVVVGGPQYRAGSHRQFTLLCRALAGQGIASMRFDYRGMGDSEGNARTFESVNDDLRAAMDHFAAQHPEVEEVVLWGLCDAAAASLFYAPQDRRVTGLVLLNPWVRTREGMARAYVKSYYGRRLLAPELWRKLLGGQFDFLASGRSLVSNLLAARRAPGSGNACGSHADSGASDPLPVRMLRGLRAFTGRVLLVLSGDDLTADEFRALVAQDEGWRSELAAARVDLREVADANHTFARAEWRGRVEQLTADWVRSW